MKKPRSYEQGVGLVEVLVALVVIMISALAFTNIQTNALVNMRMSDTRFKVNERAQDMLELLRANPSEARAGTYNYGFDDTVDVSVSEMPALDTVSLWKVGIAADFNNGGGKIDCNDVRCMVSIRWKGRVGGALEDQYFDLAGLL